MSKRLSLVIIEVNGQMLNFGQGSTFQFGGVEREAITGDQTIGYQEKPKPAEVKANILVESGLSIQEINGWNNVNVVFKLDTGQVYSMAGAWVANIGELASNGDGYVEVTINAPRADEIV